MTDAASSTPEFVTADKLPGAPLAVAPKAGEADIVEWAPPKEWTPGWRNLVLDLVDPDRRLTPFETTYFFARAKALGLDPLARQVFPMKFRGGRVEAFVGIHGIRMLAERTGQRGDETAFTVRDEKGSTIAVRVEVHRIRNGVVSKYEFTALRSEFFPKPNASGIVPSSWVEKPELMLTKCAAANAYRMAFPEVLGGLYIAEEAGHVAEME